MRIKARFGVSAEAFLYRLAELKCLPRDVSLFESLRDELEGHYKATNYAEPGETCRDISRNTRFYDLLITAKLFPENIKEVKKIEDRVCGAKAAKKPAAKAKTPKARKAK